MIDVHVKAVKNSKDAVLAKLENKMFYLEIYAVGFILYPIIMILISSDYAKRARYNKRFIIQLISILYTCFF